MVGAVWHHGAIYAERVLGITNPGSACSPTRGGPKGNAVVQEHMASARTDLTLRNVEGQGHHPGQGDVSYPMACGNVAIKTAEGTGS